MPKGSGSDRYPWDVLYYDPLDPADSPIVFLDACPVSVEATLIAVLDAVAAAPPPRFSGGGYWEAMHGEMTGMRKPWRTAFSESDYRHVRALGEAYLKAIPRRVAK